MQIDVNMIPVVINKGFNLLIEMPLEMTPVGVDFHSNNCKISFGLKT